MGRKKTENGFTLIEVAITVAIITILAFIALPTFKTFTHKYRVRSFCYDVISLLNRARVGAIEKRQYYTLTIDLDNEKVSISPSLASGTSEVDAPAGVDIYSLTNDLTTTNPSKLNGVVTKTISSSGSYLTGTTPQNFTIFIASGEELKYKIRVYGLTGNVSVEGSW